MTRTVLVATDGTPAALGALRFGKRLAEEKACDIHVLGVVEPVPVFDAGFMVALPEVELYESRRDALRKEILSQVEEITGTDAGWPVSVEAGVPGPRIVKFAEGIGAEVILMGLGRHGPMDRVFGTETALQILRISHIPILAVPESLQALPRSALMGVDFSLFSQRAAQAAVGVLKPPWEVHLSHVLSGMEFLPTLSEEWREDYEEELLERLRGLAANLPKPTGCQIHLHVLEGEPARELLAFAESREVDLLVAGSHGHSFVGRLLMGSVSSRLIRAAQVPVLVVPPAEPSDEVLAEEEPREEARGWARELNEFTRANAGRRTTLRVEDPDLGPQECGRNFPLWGIDYDPKKDRINIMLGRSGTVEGHLTHSLQGPREVQVVRDMDERAEAIHILLRRGEATLIIHRD